MKFSGMEKIFLGQERGITIFHIVNPTFLSSFSINLKAACAGSICAFLSDVRPKLNSFPIIKCLIDTRIRLYSSSALLSSDPTSLATQTPFYYR